MKSFGKLKSAVALMMAASMVLLTACNGGGTSSAPASDAGGSQSETASSAAPADSSDAGEESQSGGGLEGVSFDTSNLNELGTTPVLKETVKLTVGRNTDTNIIDMDTNTYTKMLEENVNLDLEFVYFPANTDERKQKLSVMISSGGELPDAIIFDLTDLQTYTWGSQGYFLPLNEYLDNVSVYMKPLLDEYEDVYGKYYYSPDGNMYAPPRIVEDLGNDWSHRMWINQTWLDNLDMEMPTTTDEYYEVLKAFKEQDPNGNGKADEIPLMGSKDGWNTLLYPALLGAFTYVNWDYDCLQLNDGKLNAAYTTDGWRDGLEYLNKLCSEGLLSPLTYTQDNNQFKQILENADDQLIGGMTAGSMSIYQMESERKKDMASMAPLTGPEGICYSSYLMAGLPGQYGFVTKDCKDPLAAFMMFDYMYKEEMVYQGRFGTKDVNWFDPEPGDTSLFASAGYEPKLRVPNPIWGTMQNEFWGENHPTFRKNEAICGQVDLGNPYDYTYMTANAVPNYMGKVPAETVQKILYTQEEADSIADIKATLETHRKENAVAFITGNRPISDWDNYVAEVESIGLAQYLEVSQQAYDRMMAS
ncbi:MAG: hypothetical protein ACK5LX_08610 [Oscillospiraceae bacterium]